MSIAGPGTREAIRWIPASVPTVPVAASPPSSRGWRSAKSPRARPSSPPRACSRPRPASGPGGAARIPRSRIPLLYRPFSARFQGGYVVGTPRAAGQVSQTYMFGGGNSSALPARRPPARLLHPRRSGPADLRPGRHDRQERLEHRQRAGPRPDRRPRRGRPPGRPTQFTWTVDPGSGGASPAARAPAPCD